MATLKQRIDAVKKARAAATDADSRFVAMFDALLAMEPKPEVSEQLAKKAGISIQIEAVEGDPDIEAFEQKLPDVLKRVVAKAVEGGT